eukprot:Awhi_evm1s2979
MEKRSQRTCCGGITIQPGDSCYSLLEYCTPQPTKYISCSGGGGCGQGYNDRLQAGDLCEMHCY